MVIAGLYGLAPVLSRSTFTVKAIKIREKDLATASPPMIPPVEQAAAKELPATEAEPVAEDTSSVSGGLGELMDSGSNMSADLGLVEELFAELFMLRATLAELTTEVHSLRDESRERQAKSRLTQRPTASARRLRPAA